MKTKPREYDRNGKRIEPMTKAARADRRRKIHQALRFYQTLNKPL